jgi:hypothetical protein
MWHIVVSFENILYTWEHFLYNPEVFTKCYEDRVHLMSCLPTSDAGLSTPVYLSPGHHDPHLHFPLKALHFIAYD